jgi:hypothetical protein
MPLRGEGLADEETRQAVHCSHPRPAALPSPFTAPHLLVMKATKPTSVSWMHPAAPPFRHYYSQPFLCSAGLHRVASPAIQSRSAPLCLDLVRKKRSQSHAQANSLPHGSLRTVRG